LLCGLWYSTSALSSNTGKAILNQFRYPITLTFVQFGFVAFYCLLFMSPAIRFTRMRMPNKDIIRSTFPMGLFQVGGHIFSSIAISRIPVSTVHTIKVRKTTFQTLTNSLFYLLGSVSSIHCCGLCPPFRGTLFEQNIYLTPSPYRWCHAGMLLRRFCF
jgi:solute carrier family 35 protein E1